MSSGSIPRDGAGFCLVVLTAFCRFFVELINWHFRVVLKSDWEWCISSAFSNLLLRIFQGIGSYVSRLVSFECEIQNKLQRRT